MWRDWKLFVPKSITVLRQGYSLGDFRGDVVAGLTVAIVAMPLAMALAIRALLEKQVKRMTCFA